MDEKTMTYSLPFGLKQKPLRNYFENGVVLFSIDSGKLYYTIRKIDKSTNAVLTKGHISNKEQLDQLLAIKTFSEIPTIEEVVS